MADEKRELEVLWTPKQVATYLSVSLGSVYRWISDGTVLDASKVVRFSNRVRIPRSEVERIAGNIKQTLETNQPK